MIDLKNIERAIADRRTLVLLVIFVAALAVRVAIVGVAKGNEGLPPADDQSDYHEFAERIVEGGWLWEPVSFREVGYPLVLSFAYRTTDKKFLAGRLQSALIGALTCVLIFLLAERIFGSLVALLAAGWFVFYFQSLFYTLLVQREVLETFMLTGVLLLLVYALRERGVRYLVLSALAYVLLIHVDARFVFYVPFIVLTIFLVVDSRAAAFRKSVVFVIVFVAAMIPWQYRNYRVYNEFVLVNTRTLSVQAPWAPPKKPPRLDDVPDGRPDRGPRRELTGFRRTLYDFTEFYRIYRFKGEVRAGGTTFEVPWSLSHNLASIAMYGTLLPFFLVGVWSIVRHRRREAYILLMPIVAHTLLHLIKWGKARYRVPIEPEMIIIAFFGLLCVIAWYTARRVVVTNE